ncbi:MAG: Fic family protein [Desulfobacterales bacterium]|nr:Fic family protein [Desulfobacterales bacterium]
MTPRIVRLVAEIDEFKGYWKGLRIGLPEQLQHLKILATIESIGSSTRIEGARLSDPQVAALLQGLDIHSFRSRDEQEVAGYAKAMGLIHENYGQIDLSENQIKYLHKTILQFSEKDAWHKGEYKKHPNHVAAYDPDGKQIGIIFETASPFETPWLMEALAARTRKMLSGEEMHPLLVIADFAVRFLAVHPFQDGNGRLSRILTNLLMLRSGYEFVMYSSHERMVEANKEQYYKNLRIAQKGIHETEVIDERWAEFFLSLLKAQKDDLTKKMEREKRAYKTPALSGQILELARQHGRVTPAFLVSNTGANRNTVKKHLQSLVGQKRLVKQGRGRGTYYVLG